MALEPGDVEQLESDAQTSAVVHGERRLDEQCALATSQDGRIIMVLSTAVSLSALAAIVAAAAISFPSHSTAVLTAALLALAGFSLVSAFALASIRSHRFEASGANPSDILNVAPHGASSDTVRAHWICELERRLANNEAMLERRRRLLTWAAWTFMATPIYALACGWLAAH